MNKLKISLGIICTAILISACGNNAEKENVKLVGTPKVVADSKQEEKSSDKKDQSSKETKTSELDDKSKDNEKIEDNKSNIIESNKKVEEKSTSTINTKKAIPKISYKLTNKIIVIDPGHSNKSDTSKEPVAPNSPTLKYKQTGGAQGVSTKTPEYKINMDVALKLKDKLEANGFTVVMTKTDNAKTMSNIERAKLGNEAGAGLVIRIHADSAGSNAPKGASMLIPSSNEHTKDIYSQSKLFGEVILNTVTNNVGMNNRGVIERSDMTGFNWSTVPVVLIEMGFLSNPEEDKNLSNATYQEKIANAISEGVVLLSK
jgi:N-acetylmuramoyl-L-alanine amidase